MVGVHENFVSVCSCPRISLFNKIVTPENNLKSIFIFILQQQMGEKKDAFSLKQKATFVQRPKIGNFMPKEKWPGD